MKQTDKFIHIDGINSAFWAKRDASYNFKGESHSFWEMVYVIDGTVGIAAGGKPYTLNKGEVIFHKPYEFHRIWSTNGTEPTYLVVSFDISGRGAEQLKNSVMRADEKEQRLFSAITAIITENMGQYDGYGDYSGKTEPQYSAFVYMLDLLLCMLLNHTKSTLADKDESAVIFESVVKYMEKHLSESITNDEFAKYAKVSVATLKRIFLKYSSLGVHSYFKTLKIMKAKSLLRDGVPVCYVAERLGFSNQNNFSAAFKKAVGVAPSKYR